MPTATDSITKNFTFGEFFPRTCCEIPDLEAMLTIEFVERTLQPLRDFLGAPLLVNNTRQAAGWRGIDEIQYGNGAAGTISDHVMLDINPVATGAVDLLCPKFSAAFITTAIFTLAETGHIQVPRETILEYRGLSSWVHVSFNETLKAELEFPPDLIEARPPREYNGNPHRYWCIQNGNRTPLLPRLENHK